MENTGLSRPYRPGINMASLSQPCSMVNELQMRDSSMSCCFFPELFDTFVTARSSTWLGMTCWTLNDFSWVEPNGSYSHSYYAGKRKLKWTQENLEFKSNLGTRQVHYVRICPVKLSGHFHIFCGKWTCFPAIQFSIFPEQRPWKSFGFLVILSGVKNLQGWHSYWHGGPARAPELLAGQQTPADENGGFLKWGVPPDYQF